MSRNCIARLAVIASLFLVGSGPATAVVEPCALVGNTTTAPGHPDTTDIVSLFVSMPPLLVPEGSDVRILSRVLLEASGAVAVDVVVTTEAQVIPGYHEISVAYRADTPFGLVGPLAVGSYQVRTNVLAWNSQTGTYQSVCPGALPRTTTFDVGGQSLPVTRVRVVEFYHAALDHYFMTAEQAEIADLDRSVHPGWVRTGEFIDVYSAGGSDARGSRTCRWYGLPQFGLDSHFFSSSLTECGQVATAALTVGRWLKETGDAFEVSLPDTTTGVCPSGTIPVYRLWNGRSDSNHRYTTKWALRQQMILTGAVPEGFGPNGVAMCALGQ